LKQHNITISQTLAVASSVYQVLTFMNNILLGPRSSAALPKFSYRLQFWKGGWSLSQASHATSYAGLSANEFGGHSSFVPSVKGRLTIQIFWKCKFTRDSNC